MLLRHALDNDDITVRCAALKTLCDIILVFGSTFKVEVEDKVEDYTEALGTDPTVYLAKFLRSEEMSLRDIAAQGLSRIFIAKGASSRFVSTRSGFELRTFSGQQSGLRDFTRILLI